MIFELIVNDLYYLYHQLNFVLWTLFSTINLFAYLVVLSNYQELKDLSKLQDLAKEKAASMNVSKSFLQDTSGVLSTISNKLFASSNDHLRINQSLHQSSTSTASIGSANQSTISESFDRAFRDQEHQRALQEQQMQQLKLNQAYSLLKNSQAVPLQNPSFL